MRENQLLSAQRPVKQGARRKHDGTITAKLTIYVKNWKPINKNSKGIVMGKWCPKVMPESDENGLKNFVFIPKTQKEKKNLSYLK